MTSLTAMPIIEPISVGANLLAIKRSSRASSLLQIRPLCIAMMLAGLSSLAAAQTIPSIRPEQDPAERLLKEQREREREQRLNQPAPQITAPATDQLRSVPIDADPESIADPEPTFKIEYIELIGNTVLSSQDVEPILTKFQGKKLGVNRINLLLRRLTEAFIAKGYITTRAYLGQQNLASGRLVLTVVPGKIEAFKINGQPPGVAKNGGWLTDIGTLAAFPIAVGDTLNLRDLEQGVDQINRLRRNQAELQILPGETPGGSVVALNNRFGDRYRINAGFDNHGSKATGTTRTRLGLEFDNPIGFQESLSLNYVGSLDANALLASAAIPIGYNIISYTASYSEFQNLIGDTALLFGRTLGQTIGWNRVLTRSATEKSSLDVTLSKRESEREINNIMLTPQRLTVIRAGWNRLARFDAGGAQGNWTIDLGVSRGMKAIDASVDASDIEKTDAHSQFTKFDIAASLGLPLSPSWGYRGSFAGQWSHVGLFSSEQIFAGGVGSVRGFQEGGVSGDRGYYVRNELQWMKAPQPEVLGSPLLLQPYVFIDGGRTQLISQAQWKSIVGGGFGARAQWQTGGHTIFLDALVGAPISQPAELGGKRTIGQISLTWSF